MWWHKLKIIGGMVFLLAFAGCGTVAIGQLADRDCATPGKRQQKDHAAYDF